MSDTPQEILDEIQRVKDEGLTELDLGSSFRRIDRLPEEIFELTHLEKLNLSGIYFRGEIPDDLQNLSNLTHLSLNGTYSSIPDWMVT